MSKIKKKNAKVKIGEKAV